MLSNLQLQASLKPGPARAAAHPQMLHAPRQAAARHMPSAATPVKLHSGTARQILSPSPSKVCALQGSSCMGSFPICLLKHVHGRLSLRVPPADCLGPVSLKQHHPQDMRLQRASRCSIRSGWSGHDDRVPGGSATSNQFSRRIAFGCKACVVAENSQHLMTVVSKSSQGD